MKNLSHKQAIDIAANWLANQKKATCPYRAMIILREPTSLLSTIGTTELPDVLGVFNASQTVNIEVKVSRADFFADKNKQHNHPYGHYKIYACPTKMINEDEVPDGWGLLYLSGNGGRLVKAPTILTGADISPIVLNILLNAVMSGDITAEHMRRPKHAKQWDGKARIL